MESFGARLKREREKKGVTLDDISISTKIGTRLLRALEEEHFDQLPGGIFNKGFVRAYARHLGMDEDQAIADYLEASGQTPPPNNLEVAVEPPQESRTEERESGVAQIPWGVLAIALSLVALGFAVWGFNSREREHESHEAAGSSPVPTHAAPSERTPPYTDVNAQPAPAPASPTIVSASAPTTTVEPSAAVAEFVVLIKARDDSWISITADGKQVTQETLSAATEKSVHAKDSISVHAGNVGALDFFFNGKKLPAQGDEGEVKNLSFNAGGLEPPKPSVPATGEITPQ